MKKTNLKYIEESIAKIQGSKKSKDISEVFEEYKKSPMYKEHTRKRYEYLIKNISSSKPSKGAVEAAMAILENEQGSYPKKEVLEASFENATLVPNWFLVLASHGILSSEEIKVLINVFRKLQKFVATDIQ